MKLNKKLLSLILAGILSIPMFGCSDSTVEEQNNNQMQQEQKIDEDLNNEYKQQASQKEQAEQAKLLVEEMAEGSLGGYRWQVDISDDYQRVWLKFNLTEEQVKMGILDGSWYDFVEGCIVNTREGKAALEKLGLNVDYGMMVGDIDRDSYWLGVVNGDVIYNVVDNLN